MATPAQKRRIRRTGRQLHESKDQYRERIRSKMAALHAEKLANPVQPAGVTNSMRVSRAKRALASAQAALRNPVRALPTARRDQEDPLLEYNRRTQARPVRQPNKERKPIEQTNDKPLRQGKERHCIERPTDTKKRAGGGSRPFVPFCKRK